KLALPFDILCVHGNCPTDLGAASILAGSVAEETPADGLAKGLQAHTASYSHIAGLSTMRGKDVLARLAGLLDAAMITDTIAIDSPMVFKRPVVAGTVIATVEALSEPVVLTIRPAGFPKPNRGGTSASTAIELDVA